MIDLCESFRAAINSPIASQLKVLPVELAQVDSAHVTRFLPGAGFELWRDVIWAETLANEESAAAAAVSTSTQFWSRGPIRRSIRRRSTFPLWPAFRRAIFRLSFYSRWIEGPTCLRRQEARSTKQMFRRIGLLEIMDRSICCENAPQCRRTRRSCKFQRGGSMPPCSNRFLWPRTKSGSPAPMASNCSFCTRTR